MGATSGLDVRVRAYPGPTILRDAGQLALIDRLRSRCIRDSASSTEVPLAIQGEQRAWDAVVAASIRAAPPLRVEAETRLNDIQARLRRLELKLRDAGSRRRSTSIADTPRNRMAVRTAGLALEDAFHWVRGQPCQLWAKDGTLAARRWSFFSVACARATISEIATTTDSRCGVIERTNRRQEGVIRSIGSLEARSSLKQGRQPVLLRYGRAMHGTRTARAVLDD